MRPSVRLYIFDADGTPCWTGDAPFVGDLETDAEAARRAGIPFAYAAEFFASVERSSPLSSV